MLEGFDHDWLDVGARRAAYYTNLPPRRYTFKVIAANSDGVWNDGRRVGRIPLAAALLPDAAGFAVSPWWPASAQR